MGIQEKIEDIFTLCRSSKSQQGYADFLGVVKQFWPILDNNLSLCDLSGVFTVACPEGSDSLDLTLFKEFLNGLSRLKYPFEVKCIDRLIDELVTSRSINFSHDNAAFIKAMDKTVMRTLLKFDMPLRRAFSAFAGRDVRIGGGLTWDEVKSKQIGMDVSYLIKLIAKYIC
jgi:hypothetical protein